MNEHLEEELLYQYLDGAMAPSLHEPAAQHLRGCVECAGRLAELRQLFSEIEALPELAPGRDLAPGVLAAIRQDPSLDSTLASAVQNAIQPDAAPPLSTAPAPAQPRRRKGRLIGGIQLLAGLTLLALAWPVELLPGERASLLSDQLGQWLEALSTTLATIVASLGQMLAELAGGFVSPETSELPPDLGAGGIALLAAITILWILGNTLLLRSQRRETHLPHSRR